MYKWCMYPSKVTNTYRGPLLPGLPRIHMYDAVVGLSVQIEGGAKIFNIL